MQIIKKTFDLRYFIMNFFEKIIHFLDFKIAEAPKDYGWFHLMFIGILILSTVLICVFFKNANDKTFRRIVLILWLIMVVFEIYKQLVYSFELRDGLPTWDYQWYAFPYQFCSTPMYLLPFVIFMKDCRVRDAIISYMMTFSFFGGFVCYVYPNGIFSTTLGINFQTMTHHGIQVLLGVFFAVYLRKRLSHRYFLKGLPVFAVTVALALILNECVYAGLTSIGNTENFNMFYISRHFNCPLAVLGDIYPKVPYPAFVLIYILGFSLIAAIVYYADFGIVKLTDKLRKKA